MTSVRLCEMTRTAMPRPDSVSIRSSTTLVWVTPRAAVGSSMITSWAFCMTALATATAWRWPPDSEPTGWRSERTVTTERSARVCLACSSMPISSSCQCFSSSRPRNMFCTMSRLSHRARSWCTVAIPRSVAAFGLCRWTGRPFQRIWPASGCQIPEIVLIRVDLPAPLSPTRAVTLPAGMVRLMSLSAWTGPKFLPTPRSSSSGASSPGRSAGLVGAAGDGARLPVAGRAPSAALGVVTKHVRSGADDGSASWRDVVGLAVRSVATSTQLLGRDELVLDHGVVHVRRRDPLRRQQHRRDGGLGLRVGGGTVGQRRRRLLPGAQVHGQRGGGLGLQVDRLVGGTALVTGQDVLQADQGRVLPGDREGLGLDAQRLQVVDDRRGVLVVRHQHRVDVLVRGVLLLELGFGRGRVPGAGGRADVGPAAAA